MQKCLKIFIGDGSLYAYATLRDARKGLNGLHINPKCKNILKYSFEMVHHTNTYRLKRKKKTLFFNI